MKIAESTQRHPKLKIKDAKEILNYQNALAYAEKLAEEKNFPALVIFVTSKN